MDADCLDPAYAKRSENYPPTPPSVDCRLHYISGCFTYTRVTHGGVVTVGHALARHLLWSAKLYWNTCIFVFWKCPGRILVGHNICSKWRFDDRRKGKTSSPVIVIFWIHKTDFKQEFLWLCGTVTLRHTVVTVAADSNSETNLKNPRKNRYFARH